MTARTRRRAAAVNVAVLRGACLRRLLAAHTLGARALAEESETDSEPPSAMHVLASHGVHDVKDETWNAYGQFYVTSRELEDGFLGAVQQRQRQHQLLVACCRA